ncbi:MAG: MBL fold metallo-hydrolase [Ginsengibacter sp.]
MIKVAKDVYQIPVMPRNSINCYLIEDVLIDAGIRSSHKIISAALKSKEVKAHALTHAHADHQGSSSSICKEDNIPLWCSLPEKLQAETGDATKEYPKPKHLITRFQKAYWAGDGFEVSRILKEGDLVGGFTVVETPGHSSGHISFFREKDGVLIVGDALVNMNLLTTIAGLHEPPNLFTLDREQNRKSILKLFSLKPSLLCFGHGPVLSDMNIFRRFVLGL